MVRHYVDGDIEDDDATAARARADSLPEPQRAAEPRSSSRPESAGREDVEQLRTQWLSTNEQLDRLTAGVNVAMARWAARR